MGLLATGAADFVPDPVDARGYRGTVACAAAGITYRQLDYWARTGLVRPSLLPGGRPPPPSRPLQRPPVRAPRVGSTASATSSS